jgi:endoglucanase
MYRQIRLTLLSFSVFGGIILSACAQTPAVSDKIKLNQIGFYPDVSKIAIITGDEGSQFSLMTADKKKTLFSGHLKKSVSPALNGRHTLVADFSTFKKSGRYVLFVKGYGYSFPFNIKNGVYDEVGVAAIKSFYYQRTSTALPEQYAGKWHRAAGHPDDQVLIHPSAASAARPAGTVISASKGWYDAGDYNKYIVNSGITMGTLLSLCEDFPGYVEMLKTNIPESNNNTPDMVDEIVWNLRWMLAMQDPDDGGVYHKLTNASFDGFVMPDITKDPRYVVQKSTAATLDFAAVTAQAGRLLKKWGKDYPRLADSCLSAASKAWAWAEKNPKLEYAQDEMNARYAPKISTGAYGDKSYADEFIWAATELYLSTGDENYYRALNILPDNAMPLPNWGNVRLLAYYSLLRNEPRLTGSAKQEIREIKKRLTNMADSLVNGVEKTAYLTVMGKSPRDFNWGSNSNAANQGVTLIQAYKLTKDKKYLDHALANLDYILGRNATGYSYVTGYGFKSPMHPHHRPSGADGIKEPIPGFLVGGPNPGEQDGVKLSSKVPDEAYVDDEKSYAMNEIAINWNAPLVYLIHAIEALHISGDDM